MRIAYIILCHKNSNQVNMLIEYLNYKDVDFYVHIDKKASQFTLFHRSNIFELCNNKRVDVQWATMSMVDATIMLIGAVMESEKQYDYVVLLSGQDFPVHDANYINEYFKHNRGNNFIEVFDHENPLYKRYSKRNAVKYYPFLMKRTLQSKILRNIYIRFTGGYNSTLWPFRRTNSTGLNFEYGSQWWALTYSSAKWIYNYVVHHPDVVEYFRCSLVPDECFFQTLFMASPYKAKRQDRITYFEWDKNETNPRIINESKALELTKQDRYLYARKFELDENETIKMLVSVINEIKNR